MKHPSVMVKIIKSVSVLLFEFLFILYLLKSSRPQKNSAKKIDANTVKNPLLSEPATFYERRMFTASSTDLGGRVNFQPVFLQP
jgi:hypothetical protein